MAPSSLLATVVHRSREVVPVPARAVEGLFARVADRVATVLFWAAIVLPVCYLALLVGGVSSTREFRLFFELFGLHLVSLLGGRYHD